ncbi:MAG: hypothetical protein H6633_35255 [Anaerolineales bacterium]|nr:hypothetical protein [Anaerolineales bacterium]
MRSETRLNALSVPATMQPRRWAVAVVLVLGYVVLQLLLLFTLPLTYDEGVNLQVSRFISRGYDPYSQIFTLSGPLFVWFIGWLGGLGLTVSGFKMVFGLFGGVLLINVALIAYHWLGQGLALVTAFLLGTAITFLAEAGTVVAVIPAMSIATLSLLLVLRYRVTGHLAWLVCSGFVWALAMFVSASALSIGLVTLLQLIFLRSFSPSTPLLASTGLSQPEISDQDVVVSAEQKGRSVWYLIGLWLIGTVSAVIIGLWLARPAIVIDILLANHVALWRNLPIDLAANFGLIGQFVGFNLWLFLLAVYGVARLYEQPDHPLWLAVIWGSLSLAWLVIQPVLRLVDAAILLPPLALLASWGWGQLVQIILPYFQRFDAPRRSLVWIVPPLLLMVYALISYHRFNAYLLRDVDTETDFRQIQQRDEIAAFIDQYTGAEGCVIIDDAALAIAANRLPTPQLVGLSEARVNSGLLTDKTLATLIAEGNCQAIVFSKREYHLYLNDFGSWVGANFPKEETFLGARINYR